MVNELTFRIEPRDKNSRDNLMTLLDWALAALEHGDKALYIQGAAGVVGFNFGAPRTPGTTDADFLTEPSTDAALLDALRRLVDRLDFVHAHPSYQVVWMIAQNTLGQYHGPQYALELEAARAALAAAPRTPLPTESDAVALETLAWVTLINSNIRVAQRRMAENPLVFMAVVAVLQALLTEIPKARSQVGADLRGIKTDDTDDEEAWATCDHCHGNLLGKPKAGCINSNAHAQKADK
jgi:hypothetical protein